MTMTETFATPDDFGELHASELHSSLGEQLGAEASDAFMSGARMLGRLSEYSSAQGIVPDLGGVGPPELYDQFNPFDTSLDVPIADAQARLKQEGLDGQGPGQVKLPADQPTIRQPVLDLMIRDGHERQQYAAAVNRGPQGFIPDALGFLTQIGAGVIDPVNAAAFSIPVLGEARYGRILASAGESILGRAAIRTGVGAAQGVVGGAVTALPDWWLHTLDGQDYTMADALRSVVLSAGMGGLAHGGFGALGDLRAKLADEQLHGSIAELRHRAALGDEEAARLVELGTPAAAAGETPPIDVNEVPGVSGGENVSEADVSANPDQQITERETPPHPAEVLADLPATAREDVTRSAIADVIAGEPVRVGEMLQEAAKEDPRVAQSLEAPQASSVAGGETPPLGAGAPDAGEAPRAPGEAVAGAVPSGGAALPEGALRKPGGRGPRARDPQTWSLLEFLASRGGIDPEDANIGDVKALTGGKRKFIPGFGDLVRKGGMKLDQAREAAVEAGYLADRGQTESGAGQARTTLADLLDAMDQEMRGQRVYRFDRTPDHALKAQHERAIEEERHHAETELAHALREIGEDPAKLPDATRERVLEIMSREGESDPIAALERAYMEADRAETDAGRIEPDADKIPGFDDDDVGGAASGAGGGGAGGDVATQGGDRGGPRAGGAADRSPQRLAERPNWQRLRDLNRDPDPDLTEASQVADKTPEPASVEPAKAVSAAQAAAGEADKLLADILPKLSDDERETFESLLADLKNDEEARANIIRDGAACLAEAAVGAAA